MLRSAEFRLGRTFLGRLPEEGDIVRELTRFCAEKGVTAGWISAIGTVRQAVLGYFMPEERQYRRIPVSGLMEIVSCQGNVSLKDQAPFVHLHIVLAGPDGATVAGHLFESVAFVGEFCLQEVQGPPLERLPDAASGLALWDLPARD